MLTKAYVVGTDWGAAAAWHLSLLRPDRVKGIVALSVPFTPRFTNVRPLESMKLKYGDDFYVCQFQVITLIYSFLDRKKKKEKRN